MKVTRLVPKIVSTALILGFAVGCNKADDDDDTPTVTYTEADNALIKNWTDNVAIATYKELNLKALALKEAAEDLRDNPSSTTFEAAKEAWIAVRVPWEQSESFIIGPVEDKDLDPAMDTWPLDEEADLAETFAKVANNEEVDVATLPEGQKGFHAIEYYLYGVGNSKTFASSTATEQKYMAMLAADIHNTTTLVLDSWEKTYEDGISYRERLLNSGLKTPYYLPSTAQVVQAIVNRMWNIVNEVCDTKMGGPSNLSGENAPGVESEFSDNSLNDFQNNILSVLHVYRGANSGDAVATSVSARVKAKDPTLDGQVEDLIAESIAAIKDVPPPFRTAIKSEAGLKKIQAAMDKLGELRELLKDEGDVQTAVRD